MKKLIALLVIASWLSGCAAALIAGAAGTASAVNDRRTLGNQIDDNAIEIKASAYIVDEEALNKHVNINAVSVNGILLLIGQSPNDMLKDRVVKLMRGIPGVRKLHNQIRIGTPVSISTKTHDAWLTSKVKLQLLTDERIDGTHIKVVTENSEVFLMGLVSQQEANIAADISRNVNGVARVYKAFEYL